MGLPFFTQNTTSQQIHEPVYCNREIELNRLFEILDLDIDYEKFNRLSNDDRTEFVNKLSRNKKIDSVLNE